MWHMGDGWGWWMGFGSIWMVGFWAVIIWAVFTFRARWSGEQERAEQQWGHGLEIMGAAMPWRTEHEQYETMRAHRGGCVEPIAA